MTGDGTGSAPVTLADIEAAAALIAPDLPPTPTVPAASLSALFGCRLWLKLETLQPTGSFKVRGALNKLASLSPAARAAGVVAMSAGNHAQGVAYHAGRMGIAATIVMPRHTPFTKVAQTAALGARVDLWGETLFEAQAHALALAAQHGFTLVHPYDDPLIIAGQGTAGLELMAAIPDLDELIVPIGGGGLIAGVATAVKSLSPRVRITGVQSALYPTMRQALRGEDPHGGGATLAEGIAVKAPGVITRAIIRRLVDDIVLVDETAIERAVDLVAGDQRLVAEGAGAAGVAAILSDPDRWRGRTVATILCGGNIDRRILASVLMRGLVRGGRLVRLRIGIADVPGALARVTGLLGDAGANIVEVAHKRLVLGVPVRETDVDVVVETRDANHVHDVIGRLKDAGFRVDILSDAD